MLWCDLALCSVCKCTLYLRTCTCIHVRMYLHISTYYNIIIYILIICKANLNEINVVIVSSFRRSIVDSTAGIRIFRISDSLRGVEIRQNIHEATSIPIIGDSASIVTLTGHVRESVKWNAVIFVDEHLQLTDGDTEVGFVEPVGDVPTQGAKFSTLLNEGMEEAEGKEEFFPGLCVE